MIRTYIINLAPWRLSVALFSLLAQTKEEMKSPWSELRATKSELAATNEELAATNLKVAQHEEQADDRAQLKLIERTTMEEWRRKAPKSQDSIARHTSYAPKPRTKVKSTLSGFSLVCPNTKVDLSEIPKLRSLLQVPDSLDKVGLIMLLADCVIVSDCVRSCRCRFETQLLLPKPQSPYPAFQ